MNENNGYQHLERRPGSHYKQLFVKGRKIRADILYGQTIGEDARTPEEVAQDYDLPLDVVKEAIDYCMHNSAVLQQDRDRALARAREFDSKYPPLVPPNYAPES